MPTGNNLFLQGWFSCYQSSLHFSSFRLGLDFRAVTSAPATASILLMVKKNKPNSKHKKSRNIVSAF